MAEVKNRSILFFVAIAVLGALIGIALAFLVLRSNITGRSILVYGESNFFLFAGILSAVLIIIFSVVLIAVLKVRKTASLIQK